MRRGTSAAEKFGELLYNLRIKQSLTMKDVGSVIGVPPATVSQSEKAQRAVKEEKLGLWAEALGVNEVWLRNQWLKIQKENPVGPIVRDSSPKVKTLFGIITSLSGADRSRVLGYIDALIEQKEQ